MHIVALDIFNDRKYEELHPTSHNVPVPDVERAEYQLINISDDGFVTLMLDSGTTREDLKLPEGKLGDDIRAAVDDGKDLLVSTLKAMGIEQIMSKKEV
jgi:translation initiation factor 5A